MSPLPFHYPGESIGSKHVDPGLFFDVVLTPPKAPQDPPPPEAKVTTYEQPQRGPRMATRWVYVEAPSWPQGHPVHSVQVVPYPGRPKGSRRRLRMHWWLGHPDDSIPGILRRGYESQRRAIFRVLSPLLALKRKEPSRAAES